MANLAHEYADKYCNNINDIPVGESYLILNTTSVFIPGDERSRTNPGHGYPERSEDYWNVELYNTKEKWERQIEYRYSKNQRNFVPLKVNRPKVNEKVQITIT